MFLKRTWLCLRQIQTNLDASEGLPVKTKITRQKEGCKANADRADKGGREVGEMLKMADKGGRGLRKC